MHMSNSLGLTEDIIADVLNLGEKGIVYYPIYVPLIGTFLPKLIKGELLIYRRRFQIVMICLALVGMLSACSSSGDGLTRKEGEFSFAMSGLYKPYNYRENGDLTGFDKEIGDAIAKEMGLEPKAVSNPFETIIDGLNGQKYDAVIGSLGITEKRKEAVEFSQPYYRSGAQVFIRKGDDSIKSPDDLKGKKIGVLKSSTYLDLAKEYSDQIVEYTSDPIALNDLPTGRVDAVITDEGVGDYAIQQGLGIEKMGEPLTHDEMGIAVRKGNKELQQKIDQALEAIIENGTYERISEKYFGRNILHGEKE